MRRAPKRIQLVLKAEEDQLIADGKKEEAERLRRVRDEALEGKGIKVEGRKEEDFMEAVRGWWLPEGEGICVSKIEVVGESVVFFSTG